MERFEQHRTIYITSQDMIRLENLIEAGREGNLKDREHLEELEKELLRASIVDSKGIPPDVITMNSQVLLKDMDNHEEMTYTLVFPVDADIKQNKISVLAPIGTAMLGYRVGDVIEWPVPSGLRRLKVIAIVYQPEASGDYHL
ncbi:MAG: nucleoside diphosphate kinase regulator [Nitrospirae bacterium]|jgi:regulator of nucleoside diphosphate kinase|nr:nucleoside diphosphate kinase regulator [Nitrospirota bacterium]